MDLLRPFSLTMAWRDAIVECGYDYWFWDGYGENEQQFVLKSNSNLSVYYSATFIFSANAD